MSEKLEELKQTMQAAGIVGAGGAGFPTYAKLADGADTLVINAVECEPLMYTDFNLMHEHLRDIAEGARAVMESTNISHCFIGIKDYRAQMLGLADGQEILPAVRIKYVPNVYPMGDEISLIYQATGRLVQPGCLPITQRVIVMNAETVFNVCHAVRSAAPVTEKWITVGGCINPAYTVKVPVGMRVADILAKLNVVMPPHTVLIDGGPSMGNIKNPATAIITKTSKALLILPDTIPAVISKLRPPKQNLTIASSACCQCSRCTDLCPRGLLGYPLEPHKMIRSTLSTAQMTPDLLLSATLCCSCGICELAACCQGISPRAVIGAYRKELSRQRLRFNATDEVYAPHPDRESRMLSAERWKQLLGVAKYDQHPIYKKESLTASTVEILMSQHIGAPSVPIVTDGDRVVVGQMIAKAGTGLSVPQYASIDGTVTYADATKIIIEK